MLRLFIRSLIILIFVTTTLSAQNNKAEYFYNQGKQQCSQGNYISGILQFREAIKHNPKHIPSHLNLAITYYQNGFINDMVAELDESQNELSDLPEFAMILNSVKIISRERIKVKKECPPCVKGIEEVLEDSITLLEKVKDIAPDSKLTWFNLGVIYHRQKKHQKALFNFEKIKHSFRTSDFFHYSLASTYSALGKEEKALQSLIQAVKYGFDNQLLLKINEDFDGIRKHQQFIKILSNLSEKTL